MPYYNRGENSQINIIKKGIEYGLTYLQIESLLDPAFVKDYANYMKKIKEYFSEYEHDKKMLSIYTCEVFYRADIKKCIKAGFTVDQIALYANAMHINERFANQVFLCIKNNIPIDIIIKLMEISDSNYMHLSTLKIRYLRGDITKEAFDLYDNLNVDGKYFDWFTCVCKWFKSSCSDELTNYIFNERWDTSQMVALCNNVLHYNLELKDITFISTDTIPASIYYLFETLSNGTEKDIVYTIASKAPWLNRTEMQHLRNQLVKYGVENFDKICIVRPDFESDE